MDPLFRLKDRTYRVHLGTKRGYLWEVFEELAQPEEMRSKQLVTDLMSKTNVEIFQLNMYHRKGASGGSEETSQLL